SIVRGIVDDGHELGFGDFALVYVHNDLDLVRQRLDANVRLVETVFQLRHHLVQLEGLQDEVPPHKLVQLQDPHLHGHLVHPVHEQSDGVPRPLRAILVLSMSVTTAETMDCSIELSGVVTIHLRTLSPSSKDEINFWNAAAWLRSMGTRRTLGLAFTMGNVNDTRRSSPN
ncbi:hypothetical protein AaE_007200, partial [Aphanomyces astaci]